VLRHRYAYDPRYLGICYWYAPRLSSRGGMKAKKHLTFFLKFLNWSNLKIAGNVDVETGTNMYMQQVTSLY